MALRTVIATGAVDAVKQMGRALLQAAHVAAIAALGAGLAFAIAAAVMMMKADASVWTLLAASFCASVVAMIAGLTVAARDRRSAQLSIAVEDKTPNEITCIEILDALDDLIERRDPGGKVVFANKSYRETHPLESEPPMSGLEMISTPRGARWISWRTEKVTSAGGAGGTLRMGRDVTGARRTSMQLIEARECAEAASFAKSRFLASMSHEIRTPMNGVLGMMRLLADTDLNEIQRAYASSIDHSAQALLQLIDDILDLSRIESGRLDLAAEPFSLGPCIARAVDLLAPRAKQKGIGLTWSFDERAPPAVVGDEARVRQILLNLLANAIKFTDAGSVALQVYAVDGGEVRAAPLIGIDVADTGVGFSPDILDRLFDEFDQGDAVMDRRRGGAGLGLAISRSLARAMGGDITADGREGQGATFKVTLRLPSCDAMVLSDQTAATCADRKARQNAQEAAALSPSGLLYGRCVLVVDDIAINALLARRIIERMGGVVIVAGDGAAAVAAVKQGLAGAARRIDLILMDVFMPVMCGLQASRAIAELFANGAQTGVAAPPIIALTASAYAEDRTRCLAAGMSGYLAKPFDIDDLQRLVAECLPRGMG